MELLRKVAILALSVKRSLHLFAKASPFGRGGCERSEQTERASPLK